ncbi:MAG: anaerobic ribonucleoside-triphosphate reductase activating protein [Rhodothermaceae bacterium]
MLIGGLNKMSLIDYPGSVSAVIFTLGCNFKCPFCHNPELVLPEKFNTPMDEAEVFSFLENRKGLLDGIVITGGEPTIHNDLPEFIRKIKNLGFKVKLDTNGTKPEVVKQLLEAGLLDFIAMDIKATFNKYKILSGCDTNLDKLVESIELIKASDIDYQFRNTFVKPLLTDSDATEIKKITDTEVKFQEFVGDNKILDLSLLNKISDI